MNTEQSGLDRRIPRGSPVGVSITTTSHKAHALQSWDVVRPPLGGYGILRGCVKNCKLILAWFRLIP